MSQVVFDEGISQVVPSGNLSVFNAYPVVNRRQFRVTVSTIPGVSEKNGRVLNGVCNHIS